MNVATIRAKLTAYAQVYGWLVGDVARSMPLASISVVLLSVIGIMTRLGAIGLVLAYVKALGSGADANIAGVAIAATTELESLGLWAGATLVLALIAAVSTYAAEWLAFEIASGYMRRAARLVLHAFEAGGGPQVPNLPLYQEQDHVRKLLSRDLNMVLRATLILLRCVIPLVTVIVAAVWMVMIHAMLSAIVLVFLAIYAAPFFLLNARVVRASRDREQHSVGVGSGIRRLLPMVMNRRGASEQRRNWADVYHDMLPIDENLSALQDILLARKRVGLLQDVLFGFVLVASLIVFALLLADGDTSWALFLMYLVALRFAAAALKSIASFITSSNRFVPQVRRYVEFVRSSRLRTVSDEVEHTSVAANPLSQFEIRCAKPALEGSASSCDVGPGQPVLVVNMLPLHVGSLRRWSRQLCAGAKLGDQLWWQAYYLGDVSRLPMLRLSEIVAHDASIVSRESAHVQAVFDQLGVFEEYRNLPGGLETILDTTVDLRMSRSLRYAIALMEGVITHRPIIVLDWSALSAHSDSFVKAVADVLNDRVLLLAAGDVPRVMPDIAQSAVVVEDDVIGIGDGLWYESAQVQLVSRWRPALDARAKVVQTQSAGSLLDDDDED